MTDVPTKATDRPAGGERRVHSRVTLIRTLVVVQLYTFAAYLAAAVVPYLWDPRPYPPTWMWIVPGWLLGVPGFFITMLGPVPGIVLELAGISTLVSARHSCPPRLYRWCLAGTALAVAYGLFALTPIARTIALFVAD